MTDAQSKAPVEDRIAEIRERADLESRPGRLPRSSIADLREDRAYLLTELTASQSRERALTEERDGLRTLAIQQNDLLVKIRAAHEPLTHFPHMRAMADLLRLKFELLVSASLQQSQGGGE